MESVEAFVDSHEVYSLGEARHTLCLVFFLFFSLVEILEANGTSSLSCVVEACDNVPKSLVKIIQYPSVVLVL